MRAMMVVGLSLAVLTSVGCKESKPSDYQKNMGTDGAPLLAVGNARTIAAVASGQAEWVEFRVPGDSAKPSSAPTKNDKPDSSEIENEIRDLIKDYNDVAVDRDIDETLDFFVEAQQDTLKPIILSMFNIADKLAKQRDAISTKMPDDADRITQAFSKLGPTAQAQLVVNSIEVIDDSQVSGALPPGSLATSCRFVLEDDAWYIAYDTDTLATQSASMLSTLEKLSTSIEGAQSSTDELLTIIESATTAEQGQANDSEPKAD